MFLSVELWKVSCCSQGPTGCLTSRAKTAKCGSNKKWQTCASNKTATSRQIKLKSDSSPLFYPPSKPPKFQTPYSHYYFLRLRKNVEDEYACLFPSVVLTMSWNFEKVSKEMRPLVTPLHLLLGVNATKKMVTISMESAMIRKVGMIILTMPKP